MQVKFTPSQVERQNTINSLVERWNLDREYLNSMDKAQLDKFVIKFCENKS